MAEAQEAACYHQENMRARSQIRSPDRSHTNSREILILNRTFGGDAFVVVRKDDWLHEHCFYALNLSPQTFLK